MRHRHTFSTRQIGNRVRHTQRAVGAARAPTQASGGDVQEFQRGWVGVQVLIERKACQRLVGLSLALDGALASSGNFFSREVC
jgi:hypothetical protein